MATFWFCKRARRRQQNRRWWYWGIGLLWSRLIRMQFIHLSSLLRYLAWSHWWFKLSAKTLFYISICCPSRMAEFFRVWELCITVILFRFIERSIAKLSPSRSSTMVVISSRVVVIRIIWSVFLFFHSHLLICSKVDEAIEEMTWRISCPTGKYHLLVGMSGGNTAVSVECFRYPSEIFNSSNRRPFCATFFKKSHGHLCDISTL